MARPRNDRIVKKYSIGRDGVVYEYDLLKEECGEGRHATAFYKLKSIMVNKEKKQKIIILEESDVSGVREDLIGDITKAVEDKVSKSFIIRDMLKDYKTDVLKDVKKMLDEGKKVKVRDGCIRVQIGTGKKKEILKLRE